MTTATKTALILGVANHRSIAWACVQSFLQRGDYRVVFTYQNERFAKTAADLIQAQAGITSASASLSSPCTLVALPCNVETELPSLFQERLPEALQDNDFKIDAIVHSIAYAPDMKQGGLLQTSREAFLQAHAVSAYSLLETTQLALPVLRKEGASITTLSYLGATRAVPNYNIMGPAKASLEALVRGLALEIGRGPSPQQQQQHCNHRINAVSAGPLNTMAARGISGMSQIRQHYEQHAPLSRNITAMEVANTVRFVAIEATGMTGQTVYVDGGYSIVVPVGESG